MIGRNDLFEGKETYDYDLFSIAPNRLEMRKYHETQWFHFRDHDGKRTSLPLTSNTVSDSVTLKNITYDVHLTGETQSMPHEEFEQKKKDIIQWHNRGFQLLSSGD